MEKRRAKRFAFDIEAQARVPATKVAVTILDLSASGCRLRTESTLAQYGASIIMLLPQQIEVRGWIVWKSGGTCGVEFEKPLSERCVAELTSSFGATEWVEDITFLAAA